MESEILWQRGSMQQRWGCSSQLTALAAAQVSILVEIKISCFLSQPGTSRLPGYVQSAVFVT